MAADLINLGNTVADAATRIGGGVQAIWGTTEVLIGVGLLPFGPPGVIIGSLVVVYGLDNVQAGVRTATTGVPAQTYKAQGISTLAQAAGVSEGWANTIGVFADMGLEIILTAGVGGVRSADLSISHISAREGAVLSTQLEGRAAQLANPRLIAKLEGRGYKIFQDAETQRLLDYFKANASTDLAGNISLRLDPRYVEVLEEYVHNVMSRKGLYDGLGTAELEIMTKEWMIRHQRLLGITREDATWLKKSADMYRK